MSELTDIELYWVQRIEIAETAIEYAQEQLGRISLHGEQLELISEPTETATVIELFGSTSS